MPEVFADVPSGTVTSGGTTAPASGTSESWTVTVSAAFPAAATSGAPATWFYVSDVALPGEVFLVTVAPGGTGAGQSWTVIRGADGTTPVVHTANFVISQCAASATLTALQGKNGGVWLASLGVKIAGCHPLETSATATMANQVLYWCRATAQSSAAITTLGVNMAVAGVTAGAGANRLAIYSLANASSSSATLLQQTGDMSSQFAATGWAEGPITSVTPQCGTDYIMAILTSFTGTTPQILQRSLGGLAQQFPGVSAYICGSVTGQTSIPSTLSLSGSTVTGSMYGIYGR